MNTDFALVINGINEAIEEWTPRLKKIEDSILSEKRNKQNRTIKQILGHLIDSAANNHQRMVRLQYNKVLEFPDYRQDNDLWISIQNYQDASWSDMILFWKYYNLHIAQIIDSVDKSALDNYWVDFEGTKVTLNKMIEGYLSHLYLHLTEIRELIDARE